jgi:hypothetical protein
MIPIPRIAQTPHFLRKARVERTTQKGKDTPRVTIAGISQGQNGIPPGPNGASHLTDNRNGPPLLKERVEERERVN